MMLALHGLPRHYVTRNDGSAIRNDRRDAACFRHPVFSRDLE